MEIHQSDQRAKTKNGTLSKIIKIFLILFRLTLEIF